MCERHFRLFQSYLDTILNPPVSSVLKYLRKYFDTGYHIEESAVLLFPLNPTNEVEPRQVHEEEEEEVLLVIPLLLLPSGAGRAAHSKAFTLAA